MRPLALLLFGLIAACQSQSGSEAPSVAPTAPAPVAPAPEKPNTPEPAAVVISAHVVGVEVSSTLAPAKRYAARKLFDGKPGTAWVEGSKDDGIGEKVTIRLAAEIPIPRFQIRNGLQRKKVWKKNNRVEILEVASDVAGIAPHRATLTDSMDAQTVELPDGFRARALTLTIRSVYKGSKWRDTPIAEVVLPRMEVSIPEPEPDMVTPPFVGGWMIRGAEHFVLDIEASGQGYLETFGDPSMGEKPEKKGEDCDAKSAGGVLTVSCDGGAVMKLRHEHDGDDNTLVEDKPSVFAWPITLYPAK